MRELPAIRQDINDVDEQIRALFLKRMSLALEVAQTKVEHDDKIYKPDREAEILQKRIDDQAAGGAWYPESMEAWGRGQVIQEGTYVAMIASAEHQEEIADAFEGLFA